MFAALGGCVIGLLAAAFHLPGWRTGILAALVLASHGILGMLTDGGLGCALLWPFSNERFFAPWRPLPVAPIGRAFLVMGLARRDLGGGGVRAVLPLRALASAS